MILQPSRVKYSQKVMVTQNGGWGVSVSCGSCDRGLHVHSVCDLIVTVTSQVVAGTFPGSVLLKCCEVRPKSWTGGSTKTEVGTQDA